MMNDQTNPKSKRKARLAENEAVIVPGEQSEVDQGMQTKESVPAIEDVEEKPSSESPDAIEQESRRSKQDDDDQLSIPDVLPVLPLKDTVIYPFAVQPLGVGQERSIRLIDEVMRGNRLVVLVAQKSAEIEQAGPDDIFKIGTVSRIARMIRMPDGTIQIIVQGLERVAIGEFTQEAPYLAAHVTLKPDIQEQDDATEAIKRNVVSYFQRLVALVQNVPEGVAAATLNLEEPRQVVYVIATFVQMDLELREYLLREQLKAIQRELGEEIEEQATINELRRKIDEAKMPEEAFKEANRELSRLEKLPTVSPEYSIIRTYLELLASLPWSKSTGEKIDVPRARQVLDHDHYDLEKIKDRILEYLAVRRLKEERLAEQVQQETEAAAEEPDTAGSERRSTQPLQSAEARRQINREPILCFVGPPGVGKTSLGQSIARALGRNFARMSLGGRRVGAEKNGRRRNYIGAMPGRIIQTLRRVEPN